MSRLPRPLARRIDRLARRAHAFHRWAHHPLCDAYRPELLAVGRRGRLCRGCTLTAAGVAAGIAAGLVAPPLPAVALAAGAGSFGAAALAAVRPAPGRRRSKLATRFAPAALGGAVLAAGLAAGNATGIAVAAAAAALFGLGVRYYRRRGPDRSACDRCPERPASATCSGLRPLARRERAFRRLAGRWIAANSRS